MRGVAMHAPGDVRVEEREDPTIVDPTDAIIRVTAACICGSDLWPYRGADAIDGPAAHGSRLVMRRPVYVRRLGKGPPGHGCGHGIRAAIRCPDPMMRPSSQRAA